jgi:hypothetical protein
MVNACFYNNVSPSGFKPRRGGIIIENVDIGELQNPEGVI